MDIVSVAQRRHPSGVTEVERAYQLLESGDTGQAVRRLEAAGAAGEADSFLELAVWFLEGRIVPRDLARARSCFRAAGELGELRAERAYINFLANGVGGPADWQGANERLQELATRDEFAAEQIELLNLMAIDDDGYPIEQPVGRQLSTTPHVWIFDELFSAAECAYLIAAAEPLLQQSVVVDPSTGQMRPHPVRTSEGAMFPWVSEDLVISALNRRIASASGTDAACGEPLQVLRYSPGQEYRPHLDALPNQDNQRVLTVLVYLNDAYEGGETSFTRTGLKIAGKLGQGLLFRNALPGGSADPKAEHAGLPVRSGQKFIASRWIRERPPVVR